MWSPIITGREDLARQMREGQTGQSATLYRDMTLQCKTTRDEDDGMEYVDKEVMLLTAALETTPLNTAQNASTL